MKCIEELGLLRFIGDQMSSLIKSCDEKDRLVIALLILTILSAFVSSMIDNIPFTTAMIPIILQLSEQTQVQRFFRKFKFRLLSIVKNCDLNIFLKLPLEPLVFSLALGSCLGGNGTLIGVSFHVLLFNTFTRSIDQIFFIHRY